MVERAGDPAPAVYARLFAEFADAEPRFARDVSGAIRGEMLNMVVDCVTNVSGPYQANMVRAERVSHGGFDVPQEQFDRFPWIVRDVCRELAGDAWSAEFEAAWEVQIKAMLDASR